MQSKSKYECNPNLENRNHVLDLFKMKAKITAIKMRFVGRIFIQAIEAMNKKICNSL